MNDQKNVCDVCSVRTAVFVDNGRRWCKVCADMEVFARRGDMELLGGGYVFVTLPSGQGVVLSMN